MTQTELSISTQLCRALCSSDPSLWCNLAESYGTDVVVEFSRTLQQLPFIPVEDPEVSRVFSNYRVQVLAARIAVESANEVHLNYAMKLFELADSSGITILPIKGVALLLSALRERPWRSTSDVDIIIRPGDLEVLFHRRRFEDLSFNTGNFGHRDILSIPENFMRSSVIGRRGMITGDEAVDFHWELKYLMDEGYEALSLDKMFENRLNCTLNEKIVAVPSVTSLQ